MKTSTRLSKRVYVIENIDTRVCFNGNLFAGNSLVTIMGKGDNSAVYRACTPIVRNNDGKVFCSDNNTLFAVKIVRRISSHERTALEICLRLVSENICPNFTILYGTISCPQCPGSGNCGVFVTEYARDGDIDRWLRNSKNTAYVCNVMFQICCAVYALFKHGRRAHNDLHLKNILVHPIDSGGCWKYTIDNTVYYCPNIGVLVTLSDFDKSRPATDTLDHKRAAKLIRLTCHKIPDTTRTLLKAIEVQHISRVFGLFGVEFTHPKHPVIEHYII